MLITGGTGSLGRMLVKRLLGTDAQRVIVYSRDELKQYEMSQIFKDERIRYFIGDVRDRDRLRMAFDGVDTVIHAAALKQVPACEYNPFEAVKTNILGAQNVIEAALEKGVRKVMGVSTDKACAPTNAYGKSKAMAEALFVAGNSYAGSKATRFSVVRYGNVVGSRGSVIPFFKGLAHTGKIPITDKRMSRFWITLGDAVKFVLECVERMDGGEIFVPKLPSMLVVDLAEAICPGCEQQIVGIRPGEKIHEVLLTADEARRTIDHDCYIIQPEFPWWGDPKRLTKLLPEGFEYCSGTNDRWLSVSDLEGMV